MKKYVALGTSMLVLSALVFCGTARLDEKLDAEYEEAKSKVVSDIREVDSLYEHAKSLVRAHNNEDMEINKRSLEAEDKSAQNHHDTWITGLQQTFIDIDDWLNMTAETFTNYNSLEAAHDEASASEIKTDHTTMIGSLAVFTAEAGEYRKTLTAVIDTLKGFLREHGELREKYNITVGVTGPPVFK